MRIGINLDETISALPTWFSLLTEAALASGHEIHVMTDRELATEADIATELAEHGVRYTEVHTRPSALEPSAWKATLAGRLQLDLMIEDSPEVLAKMPARTARLWLCDPAVFDLDVCVRAMLDAPAPKERSASR